jgi:prophage regulatory protein
MMQLQKVYRLKAVEAFTGKKRSALYADIAQGKFPRPIRVGDRAVAWLEQDLLEWQRKRISRRERTGI